MYTCRGVLILTVDLRFLFIKTNSWLLSGKHKYRLSPNLPQWYTWLFFSVNTCISVMSNWHFAFHQKVNHNFDYIGKTTWSISFTQRIIGENVNVWNDRDIFTLLANNQYSFFEITGETPETVIDIVQELFHHTVDRYHPLSLRNRVMRFVLWLRSHPPYHMLSTLSQKQSYAFCFMVKITPDIPYAISTFSKTELCFLISGQDHTRHTICYQHFLRNRVMLFVLWLRSHPSYHMLSALSQKQSYAFCFMVKITPVIPYAISTFSETELSFLFHG